MKKQLQGSVWNLGNIDVGTRADWGFNAITTHQKKPN
jgi:hypothetical protein